MKTGMRIVCRQVVLLSLVFWAVIAETTAQEVALITFEDTWKYIDGAVPPPANWKFQEFDDTEWSSGSGAFATQLYQNLLGAGATMTPIPMSGYYDNVSLYFRCQFDFTNEIQKVTLLSTNYAHNGLVLYLNGLEVGRFGMPAGPIVPTNLPVRSGVVTARGPDVLVFNPTNLVRGQNILVAELHSYPGHRVFASSLRAWIPTPLRITQQPQSLIVSNGWDASLDITTEGFPVFYQWQRDGVDILGANAPKLAFRASPALEGQYRVVITNSMYAMTSSVAVLVVVTDKEGPKVSQAIADNGFGSRSINIKFSEILNTTSARNTNNYTVTRLGTGSTVNITNVLYSSALGALLQLDANDPDWIPYADYVVTINNVTDSKGNVIAPNTAVPVSWAYTTNLIQFAHCWDFHASALFEPEVFDQPWISYDYVPGPWWGQGCAPFYGGLITSFPCPTLGTPQTITGWQPEPILYRTTFSYPTAWPSSATLRLRTAFDDSLVLYLNGVEIYRNNVSGVAGALVNSSTRAIAAANPASCITNINITVTSLNPGSNCLAAVVVQFGSGTSDADSYFVLEADALVLFAPALPPEPLPVLQTTLPGTNSLRLSWTGGGFALESSTNLNLGPASYPSGPWTPVPQMSNPYLWNLTNSPARFFRLKK